jgi:hypothetical protein
MLKRNLIIISNIFISINIYASSALYMSKITGEHWLVRNQASGEEAEPKARKHCEDNEGIGNCELIYKTDYGGYGAIAIGDKSQGYASGKGNQAKADRLSMKGCKEGSTASSCHITSRWHDEGKMVPHYIWIYGNQGSGNSNKNYNENGNPIDCGVTSNGLRKDCNTGRDGIGGY